ncbi:MAG: signal peptidase I [Parvibaculaceae bacterium]
MEDVQPRSKLWIWLFGLFLGPVVLMLWLGRGRLALIYLFVPLLIAGALFQAVARGLVTPPEWLGIELAAILFYMPFNIIGFVHALIIRSTSLWRPWFSRWYAAIILPFVASWLIAFVVREYFYQPFNAPSLSMNPTVMVGDHFFVSKIAYGEPQRGDVVVFKLPRDNQTDYLKRLIGLPGDRIQMRDGVLHINDVAVARRQIEDFVHEKGEGAGQSVPQYIETLPNGVTYRVLDLTSNGAVDNTEEYVVPEGHYFMMGDNRDNALDSRFLQDAPGGGVGYVPHQNLTGPVILIFWNSYGIRIDGRLQGHSDK